MVSVLCTPRPGAFPKLLGSFRPAASTLHPELVHTSPPPRGSQALGPEGREPQAAAARGQTPEARKGPGVGPQAEMSVFIACTVQTRGMRTGRWEEGELSG